VFAHLLGGNSATGTVPLSGIVTACVVDTPQASACVWNVAVCVFEASEFLTSTTVIAAPGAIGMRSPVELADAAVKTIAVPVAPEGTAGICPVKVVGFTMFLLPPILILV
jgi:hypothetical protein